MTHTLTTELIRIAAFMIPFGSTLLLTNYLTLCFGWFHLLGLEFEGYYLGCILFLAAWILMSVPALLKGDHRRAKRRPWETFVHESVFDMEAVGWAITSQLVLWLLWRATATY